VCQICLDLLHKPFALSPCGHVSCYGCLINWFNVDQQPDGREGGHISRKKTCPQCRAIVRGRPVEAWNVKDMVAAVVKSGLAQDFPQPAEANSPEAASTDPGVPSRDPWANVFLPVPSHPGTPPVEGSPNTFGMYDVEDQVHRCLDCMHEIWGGLCSQCGRHYSGHDIDAPGDEASDGEHPGIWSILPAMEQIMAFSYGDNVDESDNGSYESSFIDDSDSDSERHDIEAVDISSDGDDDSTIEVTTLTTTLGRDEAGRTQISFSEDGQDGGENGNDIGGTDESQTVRRRPTLGRRRQVLSDNDVYVLQTSPYRAFYFLDPLSYRDENGGDSAKS
jgi:Zinc finger, C3HC4 type (RING finger)